MSLEPLSHAERTKRFGKFAFKWTPTPTDPERVTIDREWVRRNMVEVHLPQLGRIAVSPRVTLHYLAAKPFVALWHEWEKLGLLDLIHAWNGSWVSRFKRQKGTVERRLERCAVLGPMSLSNHSWGTAFDINAREYPLGRVVAPTDPFRQLIPAAETNGWAWGGNFRNRPDGMHFEYVGEEG